MLNRKAFQWKADSITAENRNHPETYNLNDDNMVLGVLRRLVSAGTPMTGFLVKKKEL